MARRLAVGLLLVSTPGFPEERPVYTLGVPSSLEQLEVLACFEGRMPSALVAADRRAEEHLGAAILRRGESRRPLRIAAHRIALGAAVRDACVAYTVDLRWAVEKSWRGLALRIGDAVLVSPQLWLWYPQAGGSDVEVRFELPPGVSVSTPWAPLSEGTEPRAFRTGARPRDWGAKIAIGRFENVALDVPGATLDVALLEGSPPADRGAVLAWLHANALAIATAYGRFPVKRAQVLVVPIGRAREPVPWGQVMRGGGDAVHVYIDQTRSLQTFMQDWVLVHELSHLFHPYVESSGRWLYEGLASYYQNLLRARTGRLSEQAAWEKLHAGFRRGIRGTKPQQSLLEASEAMLRERGFMRVYWSGAAIALLADVELRRRSGGEQSLDRALAALSGCCLPSARQWSDRELMRRLDALSGSDVFMNLYRRYVHADDFPDLTEAYRRLGLRATGAGTLRLEGDTAAQALRRGIMAVSQ